MIFGINTRSDITIFKYHKWYLCQKSPTNHAFICLYYYPQRFCNFHMCVFEIKPKYHCSKPIKLQKFLMWWLTIKTYFILLGIIPISLFCASSSLTRHALQQPMWPLYIVSVTKRMSPFLKFSSSFECGIRSKRALKYKEYSKNQQVRT